MCGPIRTACLLFLIASLNACAAPGYPYGYDSYGRHQKALTGAAMGAAGGALLGGAMTQDGGGALIGGALGGVVGGLVGNSMDKQRNRHEDYRNPGRNYGYPR